MSEFNNKLQTQIDQLIHKYKENKLVPYEKKYLPQNTTQKIKSGAKGFNKEQIRQIYLNKKGTTIGF